MATNSVQFRWKDRVKACDASQPGDVVLMFSTDAPLRCDGVLDQAGRKSTTESLETTLRTPAVEHSPRSASVDKLRGRGTPRGIANTPRDGENDIPEMKSDLLELIRAELRTRLSRLAKAAMDAHAAATDPGSKAESKYDTRSLEESYLATGQARHVKDLGETLRMFENLRLRDFSKKEEIAAGALVEVERNGVRLLFLLAPSSGGLEIEFQGREITLLSPESPLYQNLLGKRAGERLDAPPFLIRGVS